MDSTWREVQEVIDTYIPDGDFLVAELTEKVHAGLAENNPELLRRWQELLSRRELSVDISARLLRRRLDVKRFLRRAQSEDRIREGVSTGRIRFFNAPFVVENNVQKTIGKINRADALYVMSVHQGKESYHRLEAAWLKEVAKRCGPDKTLDQIMTEEQAALQYRSITGRDLPFSP